MSLPIWQLKTPLDALVFDCDGTLSAMEGIDELAKKNGCAVQVEALTAEAMTLTGINLEMYQKRLDLVRPSEEQVLAIGMEYFNQRVPDVMAVLEVFKRLKKPIYIVSAGLYPAVAIFSQFLKIPRDHVFAVNITFNAQGQFAFFDTTSPLVQRNGKRLFITDLKTKHPRLGFIGDGLNDLAASDLVTRFVGFGGTYYRENIATQCEFYIKVLAMAPLLPLVLTEEERLLLTPVEQSLYQVGMKAIVEKEVLVS